MNNNKLIKNKKNNYEKKYKENIKEQVIQKEYEEEKKEMLTKINKLQKNLDHYRLIAMKNKDFGAFTNKNKDENKNKNNINSNVNNNNLGQNVIKNRIIAKDTHNPEENYDNKTLLMQSIITELTNEKKELLEKLKIYENQNNNNNTNNFNNNLQNNSIPQSENNKVKENGLLKTIEEILIADNNPNQNNMPNEVQNDLNIDNKKIENNNNNKIEEANNDNNKIEEANDINNQPESNQIENENIEKEEIKFDDIFKINLEYKNINSSNIKNLFSHIFSKYKNENKNLESNKESLLTLLINEISLKLNCQSNEEEKKLIYENIETFCNQEEDFEEDFYMIFDDIINHNEESTKINDIENGKILNSIFIFTYCFINIFWFN